MIIVTQDAEPENRRRDRADRGKDEQIGPIDPALQDRKVFGQSVSENNHKECQYAERENGNLPMRHIANHGVAFPDQPAGPKKRIAKAQADAAKDRERREPADITVGIFAVRNCSPSTRAPTVNPCIKVAIRDPPAKLKSQIHRIRCVL